MDRNEYLEIVSAQIRCKRAVPYLKEELEDHIQDQKDAYIAEGMNSFEAEMAAVKQMGDPVETGVQLDQVHRPKMEWKLIAGVCLMSIMGILIQLLILKGYSPNSEYWWYIHVLNRQLIGTALGIIILVAAYYLDYSILIKWSLPCWIVLQIAIVYLCFRGVTINGRCYQAMHFAYFEIPFLAGIVYRFRNQKLKGLLKSIACLLISVFTILMIPDMASAIATLFCGLLIITIAVYKKWYQLDRKRTLLGIWGSIGIAGSCLCGKVIYLLSQGQTSYRIERLRAWINGEMDNYMLGVVGKAAGNVRAGSRIEDEVFEYVRNDYIWKYLFEYLGIWKAVLLLLAFIIFMAVLLRGALKQKNRLGYIVGIASIMYLSMQAFLYVSMNFNMIPMAGNFMPFFSQGITPMVVSYFYMGILLSVFRNTNVVRN